MVDRSLADSVDLAFDRLLFQDLDGQRLTPLGKLRRDIPPADVPAGFRNVPGGLVKTVGGCSLRHGANC